MSRVSRVSIAIPYGIFNSRMTASTVTEIIASSWSEAYLRNPIGDQHSKRLNDTRADRLRAATSGSGISQSADSRSCLRYRHFHAERWRRVVDGFAARWPGLCGPYPNCGLPPLLFTRTTCGFRWRHLRSPQTRSIYRSLDDGSGADSGCSHYERPYHTLAAARADICPVRWRRVRDSNVARHPA